jgi:excisionase family DNA binding protein
MDTTPSEFMTVEQFCERYGFSRSHYFRMRDRGEGPKEVRAGRLVRITKEALSEWEKAHTRQAEPPSPAEPAVKKKPVR